MIETEAKQTADVGVSIVCATAWVARIVSFPVYCKFSIISPPGLLISSTLEGVIGEVGIIREGTQYIS